MNKWAWVGLGTATMVTYLYVSYRYQALAVSDLNYPVTKPAGKVSIIVCAYNEELWIERALQGIQSQNIVMQYPEMFDILVVDNESTDRTAEVATRYVRTVSAPRGKLNAKMKGVEETNGDILLFIDADAILKPNCINLLLRHLQNPNVVAVGGVSLPDKFSKVSDVFDTILSIFRNQYFSLTKATLSGGISAIRRSALQSIGGFNCNIDQFNRMQMHEEEEFGLARRLKQIGAVVVDSQATIFVPYRTTMCAFGACPYGDNRPECRFCNEMRTRQRF